MTVKEMIQLNNKMGNPSNGPAAVTWFCLNCYYGSKNPTGHMWSHLVTLFIVKELHNDGLNG